MNRALLLCCSHRHRHYYSSLGHPSGREGILRAWERRLFCRSFQEPQPTSSGAVARLSDKVSEVKLGVYCLQHLVILFIRRLPYINRRKISGIAIRVDARLSFPVSFLAVGCGFRDFCRLAVSTWPRVRWRKKLCRKQYLKPKRRNPLRLFWCNVQWCASF